MKNTLIIAHWFIVLILLAYIGQCTHRGECPPQSKDSTIIIKTVDTVRISGPVVYKPKPIEVIKTDTFVVLDTVVFIRYCSDLKKYVLPISDDSNSKISVFASVQLNEIKEWTYKAEYYPHTTVIERNHVLMQVERNRLLAGLILSGSRERFGASPVVGLKTKNDNVILIGYDLINKEYKGGYLIHLGK